MDETQSSSIAPYDDTNESSEVVAHDNSDSSFSLLSNDDEKEADAMEVQQDCAEPKNRPISDEYSPNLEAGKQVVEHFNAITYHQSLSSSTSCEATIADSALLATEPETEGK